MDLINYDNEIYYNNGNDDKNLDDVYINTIININNNGIDN